MNKKKQVIRNDNDEAEKAFDFLMMHYNRVVVMDEVNNKAINRAGVVGKAIRDLLASIQLYSRVRITEKGSNGSGN